MIAFSDRTTGYGTFEKQVGGKCQDLVGPTTDGGTIFGPLVPVTSWSCPANAPVRSLAFDGRGDGFLYGPQLWVSHDSGASWAMSAQPGAVLAVESLGRSVWMVESGCSAALATTMGKTCPLRLLESTNGGRTWASSPRLPAGATFNGGLPEGAQGQTWLERVSRSSAYLLSNPVPNPDGSPDSAPLWFTADGGSSWSARSVPCGFDAMSAVLSAAPDGTLLAVCAGQPSAGSQPKSAVRSTDNAVTWTTESSCTIGSSPSPAPCASAPLASGYLGAIDAVAGQRAFLVGDRSSLLITDGGGARWQPIEPLIGGTAAGTSQVVFFNASDGVVLGYDAQSVVPTIWHTFDGGQRWTAVVPGSS